MNFQVFIALVCSLINNQNCPTRAAEYWEAAKNYNFSPTILLSIDYQECNLNDRIKAKYFHNKKLYAIDLCPMGMRITNHFHQKLSRREIINRATDKLSFFRERFGNNYLAHYNSGMITVHNHYQEQVRQINNALNNKQINYWHLTQRTRNIIKRIHYEYSTSSILTSQSTAGY